MKCFWQGMWFVAGTALMLHLLGYKITVEKKAEKKD